MTSGSTAKARRRIPAPKPAMEGSQEATGAAVSDLPAEEAQSIAKGGPDREEASERVWADEGDLGPAGGLLPVRLPIKGLWVLVRLLDSLEITELSMLPDLTGFREIAGKIAAARAQAEKGDVDETPFDGKAYAREQTRWQALMAHVAVVLPSSAVEDDAGEWTLRTGAEVPLPCASCEGEHPRSLWSFQQTVRLHPRDSEAVAEVAMGAQALRRVRPFSEGETPEGTPQPAGTTVSTP